MFFVVIFINIMKIKIFLFFFFFISCADKKFIIELDDWKVRRIDALVSNDGYLNLAGLFLIQPGYYTIGSSKLNDFVFPSEFPSEFGKIIVKDSIISFEYFFDVKFNDSTIVRNISFNILDKNNYFSWNEFQWFIHNDPGVQAIRLRNLNHPMLQKKPEIEFFQPDENMIIKGKFIQYDEPKERQSINIIGSQFKEDIPGSINFKIKDKSFSLEPTIASSGNFFIVFADQTTGKESYGGGRFLYVNPPDDRGNVVINFNKSYNPPCVFTSFTTCPIPTIANTLNVRINAGEKMYKGQLYSSIYE